MQAFKVYGGLSCADENQRVKVARTAIQMGQVCNHLRKKQLVAQNFFELLPRYRYASKTPRLFSDRELARLKNYAMERDEQLWVIFQFIFYCFFRPGREVRLMKVGDIDFNAGLLWSRTDTAKNDKEKAVVVPGHFLEYLKKKGYHRADKNHYMFTIDGKPGKTSLGKTTFTSISKRCARRWD